MANSGLNNLLASLFPLILAIPSSISVGKKAAKVNLPALSFINVVVLSTAPSGLTPCGFLLLNKDIYKIDNSKDNTDDFINASFIYLNSVKEAISNYLDFTGKIIFKEGDK